MILQRFAGRVMSRLRTVLLVAVLASGIGSALAPASPSLLTAQAHEATRHAQGLVADSPQMTCSGAQIPC